MFRNKFMFSMDSFGGGGGGANPIFFRISENIHMKIAWFDPSDNNHMPHHSSKIFCIPTLRLCARVIYHYRGRTHHKCKTVLLV